MRLQAHFIFSATLSLSGFLTCQSHGHHRLEVTSRAMKNHILCYLIACLPGVSELAVSMIHTSGWFLGQIPQ